MSIYEATEALLWLRSGSTGKGVYFCPVAVLINAKLR